MVNNAPIVLITGMFPNRSSRWGQELEVSHGINLWTGETVCLPCETLAYYVQSGAVYDKDIGEYILW